MAVAVGVIVGVGDGPDVGVAVAPGVGVLVGVLVGTTPPSGPGIATESILTLSISISVNAV